MKLRYKIVTTGVGIAAAAIWLRRLSNSASTTHSCCNVESTNVANNAEEEAGTDQTSSAWTFDHPAFATRHDNYRIWIDTLFTWWPLPAPWLPVIVGGLTFLGGAAMAYLSGFLSVYLRSLPIYLGTFGIVWVFGAIHVFSKGIHRALAELRPCFLVSDTEYSTVIDKWLHRLSRSNDSFAVSAIGIVLAWLVVLVSFFEPRIAQDHSIASLHPSSFPDEWFVQNHREVKAAIIAFFAVVIALLLGTSVKILLTNLFFFRDLNRFPVLPAGNVVRSRMRGLANLYLQITVTWFVGVLLFTIVLFDSRDALSITFVLSLSLLGILTFLIPQVVFTRLIANSHRLTCDLSLMAFNSLAEIRLRDPSLPRVEYLPPGFRQLVAFGDLSAVNTTTQRPRMWVYDATDMITFAVSQGSVLSTVLLPGILR